MIKLSDPIQLTEYKKLQLPKYYISDQDGEKLWRKFGEQITVEDPSFKNNYQWEMISKGYVGFIPVSDDLSISIKPKTSIKNLFGMWEYAYRLKSIKFLADLFKADSLQDFYSELANILAKRINDRSRKGYYRAYIPRTEDLSYLKGKMDLRRMISTPWIVQPRCSFQEHTADVDENQILAWTLYAILRSGFCADRRLPSIRAAFRNITHFVTLAPFQARDCIGRMYNRLNIDYKPLHVLCRFFLENSGPSYDLGDRKMLPFLVKMDKLFELFIAEWMISHLSNEYSLESQEPVDINEAHQINLQIDLVLYQNDINKPICVLDTKYKTPEFPSRDDIAQIYLYAAAKKCKEGILVYPEELSRSVDITIQGIRIRSTTFNIGNDLEQAGKIYLEDILRQNDVLIQNIA